MKPIGFSTTSSAAKPLWYLIDGPHGKSGSTLKIQKTSTFSAWSYGLNRRVPWVPGDFLSYTLLGNI